MSRTNDLAAFRNANQYRTVLVLNNKQNSPRATRIDTYSIWKTRFFRGAAEAFPDLVRNLEVSK